jgi:hypothetical protein
MAACRARGCAAGAGARRWSEVRRDRLERYVRAGMQLAIGADLARKLKAS